MKTQQEWEAQLASEGFRNVKVVVDPPGKVYPEHTHDCIFDHIVMSGSISLTMNGTTHNLKPGDRGPVPKGVVHSAQVGPEGCTYVMGEK